MKRRQRFVCTTKRRELLSDMARIKSSSQRWQKITLWGCLRTILMELFVTRISWKWKVEVRKVINHRRKSFNHIYCSDTMS